MECNYLIHAIPNQWKNDVKDRDVASCVQAGLDTKMYINDVTYNLDNIKCKDYYWEFTSLLSMVPTCEQKWSKYLEMEGMCWQDIYTIPFTVTRETYVQSFQYKILHRFYPCNYTLSNWYKDHSPTCSYCDDIDFLEHYFFECIELKGFWQSVEYWWKSTLSVTFKLKSCNVIFGIVNSFQDPIIDIINYCILYAKYYIHLKKTKKECIFFPDLVKLIKDKLHTEKVLCIMNNVEDNFEKRWTFFYECL